MKIDNFPHAHFDIINKSGYLFNYYTYNSVQDGRLEELKWRNESYSPELLNYKKGSDKDIKYFTKGFRTLIYESIKLLGINTNSNILLVPVPSSKAFDDPDYTRETNQKGNRDNRNEEFCNLLFQSDKNLICCNIICRIKSKTPKEHLSALEHRKSFEYISDENPYLNKDSIFILIDDVKSKGGTIDGCELLLKEKFPTNTILKLTFAIAKPAHEFHSLKSS